MRGLWFAVAVLIAQMGSAQQRPAAAPKPAPRLSEMERAIEEFKVLTRNLGIRADSPRKQSNVTKPTWHGRLFEYFRNDFLDAVPHEVVQRGETKSLLRRNQFGFNITGPVVIPRVFNGGRNTYFSLSYEGVRERISRTYLRTIPTGPERSGDYSTVVDQAGDILPIYDPATTAPNPAFVPTRPLSTENLQYLRAPFVGNRIPAARIDPAALAVTGFYPDPNSNAGPFFRNNYFINAPETNIANGIIAKVDHTLGERQRLTFDVARSNGFLGSARWFPSVANPGPADREFATRRGSIEHVFTISPQAVNAVTFGLSSDGSRSEAEMFPIYQFDPYLSMGRSYPVSRNARNT